MAHLKIAAMSIAGLAITAAGGCASELMSDPEPVATGEVSAELGDAGCTWSQWGQDASHSGSSCVKGQAPENVPEAPLPDGDPIHLPALLSDNGLAVSTSEARRLIDQGGVRVNDEVVRQFDVSRERLRESLIQVGKRRFLRLTAD